MKTNLTKEVLFWLMGQANPGPITINGITGIISSVQREDASGRSFNVTLNTNNGQRTTYVRCAA